MLLPPLELHSVVDEAETGLRHRKTAVYGRALGRSAAPIPTMAAISDSAVRLASAWGAGSALSCAIDDP